MVDKIALIIFPSNFHLTEKLLAVVVYNFLTSLLYDLSCNHDFSISIFVRLVLKINYKWFSSCNDIFPILFKAEGSSFLNVIISNDIHWARVGPAAPNPFPWHFKFLR